ncbi:hypothetical protein [Devosia sp. DBB001]|nr:hypothetical protein [Devosia sp. DBB001]
MHEIVSECRKLCRRVEAVEPILTIRVSICVMDAERRQSATRGFMLVLT